MFVCKVVKFMKNKIVDILLSILYALCVVFVLLLFLPIVIVCIILIPFVAFLGFIADIFAGVYNDY